MKDWNRQLFSTVLATTLLVSNTLPALAFAAESKNTGLCEHHMAHTECGYVEAKLEVPCAHDCTKDEACGGAEFACTHLVHDVSCGYSAAMEGKICNYLCEACAEENASAFVVAGVKAQIDAMPPLDAIQSKTREEQLNDYNQIQSVYEAYEKLTADQKTLLPDSSEVFGPYFEYFNSQIVEADMVEIASGTCGDNLTWTLSNDGVLTIAGTGSMDNFIVEEDNGIYYPGQSPWNDYKEQIKHVLIEEGVTTIGHCAFSGCPVLEDVSIPEGLISIGEWAFDECENLNTIELPDSLKTIEQFAFSGAGLTDITIPNSVTKLEGTTFSGCSNLNTVTLSNKITEIPFGAFSNCGLTQIEIPSSVTVIGADAFYNCVALTSIVIPESVTTIMDSAFCECTGLKNITFDGNAPTIQENSFLNVTATAYYPVNNDTWTEDIMQGYGGAITWAAYEEEDSDSNSGGDDSKDDSSPNESICGDNLTWVYDAETKTLTICGSGAMYDFIWENPDGQNLIPIVPWKSYSSEIKSVVLEEGVTNIGNTAFYECRNLSNITIPASVNSIGTHAFCYCSSLTSVSVPSGLTKIGDQVFLFCNSLKNVTVGGNVTDIGYEAFRGCVNLTDVEISGKISTIDNLAFYGCENLLSLTAANGISSIGDSAFYYCKFLTSITLASDASQIGYNAFSLCDSLSSVYFKGNAPAISYNAFPYVITTAYYPSGNDTWTEDVRKDYGGDITWVPYTPDVNEPGNDEEVEPPCALSDLSTLDYLAFAKIAYLDFQTEGTVESCLTKMGYWADKYWDSEREITYAELCANIANWEVCYSMIANLSNDNGFFAVPFQNKNGEVVLAYRGSESALKMFTDWDAYCDWVKNDFPMELFNNLGDQYSDAIMVYKAVAKEYGKSNIVVTGHSLGGAWADVVSAYSGCKGVTFNAVSALDTVYNAETVDMGRLFAGVDQWNFMDHTNQNDTLAGMFESHWSLNRIKPNTAHYSILDPGNVIGSHDLIGIVEEDDDGSLKMTDVDMANSFTPFGVVTNHLSFTNHSVDFGTSWDDTINEEADSVWARKTFGGDGSDSLTGGILSDTLIGGRGYDNLDGSWMNDTYIYYKGDSWDTIYDVSGTDELYLYDFEDSDTIEAVVSADENTIDILCNGSKIVSIFRKNREYFLVSVNRFVVHVGNKEYDITSLFNSVKYSARIKIACPVDVQIINANGDVMYTLKDGVPGNFYTDYGNFYVYEEVDGGYGKVLDLREGYTVNIVGMDNGAMNISYRSVDNGELSDAKTMNDIPVTSGYKAILTVDESGEIHLIPSDDTHATHTAGTDWFHDENNHWHKCTGCEDTMDLTGHSGGTATCMAKAVCTVCNQAYGVKDAKNHTGNTTVEGKKDSNCGVVGYTGDTVCECGEIITKGEVIPATGKHTGGTATCMEQAVCKTCGLSYGEKDPKKHRFTKYESDHNATCKMNGTKTAKCDYSCGETDTVTDRGSKLGHKYDGNTCVRCGLSRWNPDTGDKIMIAIAVLIASGAALLLLLTRKKRK